MSPDSFLHSRTLSAPPTDHPNLPLLIDDHQPQQSDWIPPDPVFKVQRAVSVGSKQYGFTSLGRGFNWLAKEEEERNRVRDLSRSRSRSRRPIPDSNRDSLHLTTPSILGDPFHFDPEPQRPSPTRIHTSPPAPALLAPAHPPSPRPLSPASLTSRSPTSPRPPSRRRSSHKRISLVAGRVRVLDDHLPVPISRHPSQSSIVSTCPPSPTSEDHFLGEHSINDFAIEGDAGRGAYGMVKRARQKLSDGSRGPVVIVKQVIKSRILADCWKKHPVHGTIPIEIYVLSSVSNTTYVLPPPPPWDPARRPTAPPSEWRSGTLTRGHPNICPLTEFFEDAHFYYLVMPSTAPSDGSPADLFDLVELYPQGLPAHLIRSYLGQIADALAFLHAKGIVHRDIKDENVVLGPTPGRCILIDFGSSGIVRRNGWDTFSGTLDYAGPEILRGESYTGPPQDVWAFGVVAFVLLVGECPFVAPADAQAGLESPFCRARMALDERCLEGGAGGACPAAEEQEGEEARCAREREEREGEADGGGALRDAWTLVRACLEVEVARRPAFDKVLQSRFLAGKGGW